MKLGIWGTYGNLTAGLGALIALCILTTLILPGGNLPVLNATTVTIKTQEAADSVPGGIRGVDVSVWQGNIDWARVSRDNIHFAMVRATYGLETDENFLTNVYGASENGLHVGAYHYAKFTDEASVRSEARYFLDELSAVRDKITYPIVLDLENNRGKMTRRELTDSAKLFMDLLRAEGYTVLLYSYENYFNDYLLSSELGGYDLWVANYVNEPSRSQKMWQHTSYGTVDGITGRALIDIAYADLSTGGRRISVNRTASNTIKATINERHGTQLTGDSVDMAEMKRTIVTAMQSELNRQLGVSLSLSGEMDAATLDQLEQVGFAHNQTSGNMTWLLQAMLFYKGYYTDVPNGAYDDNMLQSVKRFQQAAELEQTGQLDRATLWYILR